MSAFKHDLVMKIHSTPHKAVLAVTGGGAEVFGELLRYGKGSNTVLEATVPYLPQAFDRYVKGTPDKYCSPQAARDLAMASYQRAISYVGVENAETLIGIGASCSLAKDKERDGREHHAFVAIQTAEYTATYDLQLTGKEYSRELEEEIVSIVILGGLSNACGLYEEAEKTLKYFGDHLKTQRFYSQGTPEVFQLLTGQIKSLTVGVAKGMEFNENRTIFPGSFNPFHPAHEKMAEKTYEITGKKVDLEICVHNVDKPALNYTEFFDRRYNLMKLKEKLWCGDIHFTSLPTFVEKAQHFYGATFVLGWDTLLRISDPKYGKIDEVVNIFEQQNAQFIAFHRVMNGKSSHDEGTEGIDHRILKRTQIVPPEISPPIEMSSSEIRKKQ